ncbi:MAG TPA: hypothetical protein VFD27_02765 [Chthoniobacteraceae bacterium]|nr:hypothetical protein [Chthoniobacteraceae bacterium]
MNPLHLRWLIPIALAMPAAAATLQDAPPPDLAAIRDFLTKLQAQQEAAVKQRRASAFDTVKAAATNGEKAVALWKEAVKTVMFEGAEDETTKLRAWREGDGDALNSKEAQMAAKLHLTWLFFTLQHHAGVKTKDLIPFVIDYTAQLAADGQTMDTFEDNLEKTREREASGKHGARKNDDARVKTVHDTILNTPVTNSPVAKYLGLDDILPRAASQNDRTARAVAKLLGSGTAPSTSEETWPLTPGDLDGIHRAIILPEYRAMRDQRIVEYWDGVIRREAETVAKRKINYEETRFNQVRKPALIWQRAQDLLAIGLRNRAILEMVAVLKANTLHPQAEAWLKELESVLATPATTTAPAAPAAPATPPAAPPGTSSVAPRPGAVPQAVR